MMVETHPHGRSCGKRISRVLACTQQALLELANKLSMVQGGAIILSEERGLWGLLRFFKQIFEG